MQIGIGTYYLRRYGLEDGACRMAKDGYTFVDYNLDDVEGELYAARDEDFLTKVTEIRRTLNNAGVSVSQIHGPWHSFEDDTTEEKRAVKFEKMTKAMVIAKYLGAKYMAIHPLMPYGYGSDNSDEVVEINRKYYTALTNVAAKLGVVICLENMPFRGFPLSTPIEIADFVNEIAHPNFKMCFDLGHANIFEGRISDMLKYAGSIIKILHVHDNFGDADTHLRPYEGTVDFADFAEGLFDIGYDGILNLETAPISKKQQADGISDADAEAAERDLARIAKLIAG